MIPVVLGLAGTELTAREIDFIKNYKPFAFLLFARNISSVEQTRKLTSYLRELVPGALIGVDQEGGRVQRLTFHGRYPASMHYGKWYQNDPKQALVVAELHGFLLAADLVEVGADWVYAPVLDRMHANTHEMIASRTLSDNPEVIVALARAILKGLKEGGCHGCLKHAPGQGLATLDSHLELPRVDASLDELQDEFRPFEILAPEVPFIMTSHTAFTAFGEKPTTLNPVLLSKIRDEWKSGLILADDLGMKALKGTYVSRFRAAIEAGCDLAICSFSRLKEGMAGTVYAQDEADEFFAAAKDFPQISERVKVRLQSLQTLLTPDNALIESKREKFKALWADVPEEVGYTWPV